MPGLRDVEPDGCLLCSEEASDVCPVGGERNHLPQSYVIATLFVCVCVCVKPDYHPVGLKCVAYPYTRSMRSYLMIVY